MRPFWVQPVNAPGEPTEVRLAPESIASIAASLAELLGVIPEPQPEVPPRLLSAAEVARWWAVERSWVYNHARELGACRLGDGPRPRLRFDRDEVAERLGAPLPKRRDPAAGPPIRVDSQPDSFSPRNGATVGETGNQTAGRRSNAPGPAPKTKLRRDQQPSPAGPSRRRLFRRPREEASNDGS